MIDVFLVGDLARQNNREEWKDGTIQSLISERGECTPAE